MLSNEKYLKKVGITVSHENYTHCLEILESYGENRWWLSDDPKTRAYYQALECTKSGVLLLPKLLNFQTDLFELLGRPVSGLELVNPNKIFREAEEAWQGGSGVSKQEGQKRLLNAIETLKDTVHLPTEELLIPLATVNLSVRERGGMHLGLESNAQMRRAQRLVKKNPGKYEISNLWSTGEPAPLPRFYYWAHPEPEGILIMQWIKSGRGTEPT